MARRNYLAQVQSVTIRLLFIDTTLVECLQEAYGKEFHAQLCLRIAKLALAGAGLVLIALP